MFKKDFIFWWATFLFILGIVVASATGNQLWLFILAGSYLLRPTLASLNIGRKRIDERQMSIQYRSGNIAFAVMIIGCIAMAFYQYSKDDHSWEFFNAVVILGLAAKALSNVVLNGNYCEAARKIVIGVGLMMILFATLENGFSINSFMESLPGLAIVGVGFLSIKFPRIVGGIIFVITALLLVFIFSKGFIIGQIIAGTLISVPLILAGVSFFIGDKNITEPDGGNL